MADVAVKQYEQITKKGGKQPPNPPPEPIVRPAGLYHCTACDVYGDGRGCWCCGSTGVVFYDADDHPLNNLKQPERDLTLD